MLGQQSASNIVREETTVIKEQSNKPLGTGMPMTTGLQPGGITTNVFSAPGTIQQEKRNVSATAMGTVGTGMGPNLIGLPHVISNPSCTICHGTAWNAEKN